MVGKVFYLAESSHGAIFEFRSTHTILLFFPFLNSDKVRVSSTEFYLFSMPQEMASQSKNLDVVAGTEYFTCPSREILPFMLEIIRR